MVFDERANCFVLDPYTAELQNLGPFTWSAFRLYSPLNLQTLIMVGRVIDKNYYFYSLKLIEK